MMKIVDLQRRDGIKKNHLNDVASVFSRLTILISLAIRALWDLCRFLVMQEKDMVASVVLLFTVSPSNLHTVSHSSRYYVRIHAFNRLHAMQPRKTNVLFLSKGTVCCEKNLSQKE